MGINITEFKKHINFDVDKNEELKLLLLGKKPKKDIDKALNKAVKPYGFQLLVDDEGQIYDLSLISTKTGDEAVLLDALAGYLSDDSFYEISMESDDEDQLVCRWDYSSQAVKYSEWLISLDSEEKELARKLVTESSDDDHDPEWYCGDNMIKCRSHFLQLKQQIESLPYQLDVNLVSTIEIAYLEITENGSTILKIASTNTDRKSIRNYYLHGAAAKNELLDKVNQELEKRDEDLFATTDDASIILKKIEMVLNARC